MSWTTVDLFCGAGGTSLGLKETNLEVRAAIDNDEVACQVYDNYLPADTYQADLTETSIDDVCDYYGMNTNEIDVIVGCPPCQNFSTLRRTTPWREGEPKDELLVSFVDLILEASPGVVIFENVEGILKSDDGQYIEWFNEWMRKAGYGVALRVVDAADYGVPQRRKRAIGICVHGVRDEEIKFPEPTHAAPNEATSSEKKPWRTVREAIGNLPVIESGETSSMDGHQARNHQSNTLDIIRAVPEDGGSRADIPDELELDCHKRLDDGEARNVYGRMAWDEPAPTLTTRCTNASSGRFIHPKQHRAITLREAARLMTFPNDFSFPEHRKHASRLIGNAVPPTLMETLVNGFLNQNENLLSRT